MLKRHLCHLPDVHDELIYEIVRAVFDNFDNFKTLHSVFSTLTPEGLVIDGNTAPLHDGAKRYFEEKGLIGDKIENEKAETS